MDQNERESGKSLDREQQYDEFVMLLARHDMMLRRFVRSLLPSRDGVEDVVQETALECWKKYADFQPSSAQEMSDEFVRWACVIARFKALSWQRDKSRERLVFRENVVELLSKESIQLIEMADRERDAIETCLRKLPEEEQRLVLSVHSPGQSVVKIAQQTGVKARRLYSKVNALRTLIMECVQRKLAEENVHG